jgi:Putative prokaryotic signal transducing protein
VGSVLVVGGRCGGDCGIIPGTVEGRGVEPDGTVSVAVAANQSEAELLQGLLADAGIPSTWRRTGGDLPDLLSAGYREIYVPAAAAEEARALLATVETPDGDDVPPTRRIGLEHTGLRLFGKAAVVIVVSGILIGAVLGIVADERGLGMAVVAFTLLAGVGVVAWSERG